MLTQDLKRSMFIKSYVIYSRNTYSNLFFFKKKRNKERLTRPRVWG